MSSRPSYQGFTLIELIVVLSILAILAATAIPRFINLQSSARASSVQAAAGAMEDAINLGIAGWETEGGGLLYTDCTFTQQAVTTSDSVGTNVFTPVSTANYSSIANLPGMNTFLTSVNMSPTNVKSGCLAIDPATNSLSAFGLSGMLNIGNASSIYPATASTIAGTGDTTQAVVYFSSYTAVVAIPSGSSSAVNGANIYLYPTSMIPDTDQGNLPAALPACYAVFYDAAGDSTPGTVSTATSGC